MTTRGRATIRTTRTIMDGAMFTSPALYGAIYWNGPGGALYLAFANGQLVRIEHPTADGQYATLREAREAARAFIAA